MPEIKEFRKSKTWMSFVVIGVWRETVIPINYSDQEMGDFLRSGKYVPQNKTNQLYDLDNFPAAPSSIKGGDKTKGATGH